MKYLLLLFFALQAQAGIVFDVQGTQLNAVVSSSGATPLATYYYTDLPPQPMLTTTAGVFGGSAIAFNQGNYTQDKWIAYPGFKNWTDTPNFSILLRIIPGFSSGSIAATIGLFVVGLPQETQSGSFFHIYINTNSTLEIDFDDHSLVMAMLHTTPALAFTAGVPTDIMVTYQSGASPNLKVSQDGASIESTTITPSSGQINGLSQRWLLWPTITFGKFPGQSNATSQSNFQLNEAVIWDDVEPYTYAVRTGFIPVTPFDGTTQMPYLVLESNAPFVTSPPISFSQGDAISINMRVERNGVPVDLTNATLSTEITATGGGVVTIPSTEHVINPDQVNFRGQYKVMLSTSDTAGMAVGNGHEVITEAVNQGKTVYYHAPSAINVLSNVPSP